jgi:Four helix bundle sensory module for signal transduction
MFKRELFVIFSILFAIVILVAGTGWYAIWQLQETSHKIVVDTLPGLADAGLAQERMNDNRRMMRELLIPHTNPEREKIIEQIRSNNTENLWRDYANSIFEPEDLQNYNNMMQVRSNYLQGCEMLYGMVYAEKIKEADEFNYGELSQRFRVYNGAAKKLFDFNVKQGIIRGQAVTRAAKYAPWLITGFCLLVFGAGFALGLRSALGG